MFSYLKHNLNKLKHLIIFCFVKGCSLYEVDTFLKCILNVFFSYENIRKTGKNAVDHFLISYPVPEI